MVSESEDPPVSARPAERRITVIGDLPPRHKETLHSSIHRTVGAQPITSREQHRLRSATRLTPPTLGCRSPSFDAGAVGPSRSSSEWHTNLIQQRIYVRILVVIDCLPLQEPLDVADGDGPGSWLRHQTVLCGGDTPEEVRIRTLALRTLGEREAQRR